MNDRCPPKFESRIGTATIGAAFMAAALFVAIPNGSLLYHGLAVSGTLWLAGPAVFLSGLLTFLGSVKPCRKVRHTGQIMCFGFGLWMMFNAMLYAIVPPTPIILAVLGVGSFVILIKDVFAGVAHRNDRRSYDRRGRAAEAA